MIADLWARHSEAEVVVASRYVAGGDARMSLGRRLLSRSLNAVFGRGLSLGVRDMSSGFRLYRADVVRSLTDLPRGLDALQAILVKVYAEGWRVVEVPFSLPPAGGRAVARARAPLCQRLPGDVLAPLEAPQLH